MTVAAICVVVSALLAAFVPSLATPALIAIALLGTLIAVLLNKHFLALGESSEQLEDANRAQRKALDSLETEQDSFNALAEGLGVVLFLCDSRGNVLYANRAARAMFEDKDPIDKSVLAIVRSAEVEAMISEAPVSGKRVRREFTLSHPHERIVKARTWRPSLHPERVFLSLEDVTDLRRLERIRQDFVANVSHELRTPMTTIRTMTETLQEGEPEDQELQDRYVTKIIREVDRLTHITEDLLTLSMAENQSPSMTRCDLAAIVHGVVSQLKNKAEEAGLKLDYSGPESIEVHGHADSLTQIAINLIDNAINYTPEGSISVELVDGESEAKFAVKDTGIGIATEHLPRIFERFYRVDKGRSRATGGTGLGLAIVRHLVEAQGGTLEVDSDLNQGSTFTVTLPKSG